MTKFTVRFSVWTRGLHDGDDNNEFLHQFLQVTFELLQILKSVSPVANVQSMSSPKTGSSQV